MTTFFVVCAALGGGVLVVQLLLGLLGVIDAGGMRTSATRTDMPVRTRRPKGSIS